MKNLFAPLLLIIFFTTTLLAQNHQPLRFTIEEQNPQNQSWTISEEHNYTYRENLLLSDKGNRQPSIGEGLVPFSKEYQYNNLGDLILELNWYFNSTTQQLDTSFYITYEYNNQRQITKQETIDIFGESYFNQYSYDQNNCLLQQQNYRWWYVEADDDFDWVLVDTYDYERNSDCAILKEIRTSSNGNKSMTENIYDSSKNLIEQYQYFWNAAFEDWEIFSESIFKNDLLGRVDSVLITNHLQNGNMRLTRKKYTYDNDSQIYISHIEEEYIEPNSTWRPITIEEFIFNSAGERLPSADEFYFYSADKNYIWKNYSEYEFDGNNFLINKIDTRQFIENGTLMTSVIDNFSYLNRCDGAMLETYIENLENLDICNPSLTIKPLSRKIYTYGIPAFCESQIKDFSIKTFPNPTSGIVNINSELLYYPDTEWFIFSTTGQMLFNDKTLITNSQEINFSTLPNGSYFLFLENKNLNKNISTKITVIK